MTKAEPPHIQEANRLQTIGYASGAFAKSLQWNSVGYLLLFYFTDFVGLSPELGGLVILLSLFWAGVIDPPLSYFVDKSRPHYRYYARLMLFFAPASALSYIALFYLPDVEGSLLVVYAVISTMLFRTAYSIVDIPHNALLSSLSQNSRSRTTISAARIFFNSTASLALALAVAPLLSHLSEGGKNGFIVFAIALSTLYVAVISFSARSVWRVGGVDLERQKPAGSIRETLSLLGRNKPLLLVLLLALTTGVFIPVFVKLAVFYAKIELGDAGRLSVLLGALALGQMLAMPVWNIIAQGTEKRTALVLTFSGIVAVSTLFLMLAVKPLMLIAALFFCFGFCSGGITMLTWALLPDTVDYGEHHTGVRNEALSYGLLQMVIKLSEGLSIGAVGLLLGVIGYTSTSSASELLATQLTLLMSGLPIFGAIMCITILNFYRLSHKAHADLKMGPDGSRPSAPQG